jgi:F1F0 ATPase subunit 2
MADPLGLLAAGAFGLALGTVFFAGLWGTIRLLPGTRYPALLILVSFFLRSAVVVLGLALLAGDVALLVVGVSGLLMARWWLLRRGRAGHATEVA